jgi:hypothetical protein
MKKPRRENKKARSGPRFALVHALESSSMRSLPAFSFREKAAESLRRSSRCHNQSAFLALVAAESKVAILSATGEHAGAATRNKKRP